MCQIEIVQYYLQYGTSDNDRFRSPSLNSYSTR